MTTERDKANRIVKEIISYFMANHIYDLDMHFHIDDDLFKLDIKSKIDEKPSSFDKLLKDLNVAREFELEEYYNSLLGGHGHEHDYTFLGKAIDEAIGSYENGELKLSIIRRNIKE